MGHSQAEKVETHRRIVETAARRLRQAGLFGVGVADLMKDAGLTVGGFYKHFASREAFIAEVLASIEGAWSRAIAEGRAAGKTDEKIFADLIDTYLSEKHRDDPGSGCMFAAVGDDIARSGDEARTGATEKLRHGFDLLAGFYPRKRKPEARALAIVTFSALIGAVTFARLVNDEALSQEILRTVRKTVKSWSGPTLQ